MALKARSISAALVNGRLSARSAARWQRMPRTISWLLGCFDLCLAQSRGDAERLKSLGAHHVEFTGNLKLDVPAPAADEIALASLREAIGAREILVAASTHEGEEVQLAEVHRRISESHPSLLTIIAPRHPERGPGIAQEMAHLGLKASLRSRGRLPEADSDIYIADTLGELGLLYRLGGPVFVGGSLIRHGGQNPIEPAKLDAVILHGPHVFNFNEIYGELDAGGGAREIGSAEDLAGAVIDLLDNPPAAAQLARRARQIVEQSGGALEKTLAALTPLLSPREAS
jgi:3-deoxy-D-manno-octulosonic-acid transferase